MITSDADASAPGDAAACAPAATSGAVFAGVRFQTVTRCPCPSRRVAMAAPMRPVPAMPTSTIDLSLDNDVRNASAAVARAESAFIQAGVAVPPWRDATGRLEFVYDC